MFTKLSLSLIAAFLLSAAGGVARAAPTAADFNAAEAGIPDSIDYANRMIDTRSSTKDELNAAQADNPESPGYKDRMGVSSGDWRAAWQALESGHPDFG